MTDKISKELHRIIMNDTSLSGSVIAVYGIGSLAKRRQSFRDVDLNIFVERADFTTVASIAGLQEALTNAIDKSVDVNVIPRNNIEHNMINSDMFVHKNRHALFLYELTNVPCLLYGDDILHEFQPHYSDLLFEAYKLAMTQVHRMNKEYLAKDKTSAIKNIHKYARYTCEFAMIFKGYNDAYMGLDAEIFLRHYPEMEHSTSIVESIFNGQSASGDVAFAYYYDFMEQLTNIMHHRLLHFLATIHEDLPSHTVIGDDALAIPEVHFTFPSMKELRECQERYTRQPDYAKVVHGLSDKQVVQSYLSRYETVPTADRPCLILFVGLPGSGKTTRARLLETQLPAVRLSSDEIKELITNGGTYDTERIFRLQSQLCDHFFLESRNIIIDSNCDKESVRAMYTKKAEQHGYQVRVIYLDCPVDMLMRRMQQRNSRLPGYRRHAVDHKTLLRHAAELELPLTHLTLDTTLPITTTHQSLLEYVCAV